MSIFLPQATIDVATGSGALQLDIPTEAFTTPANTGWVLGFFVRTLPQDSPRSGARGLLSRGSAGASGSGGEIRFTSGSYSAVDMNWQAGGSYQLPNTQVATPGKNKPFLVLAAQTDSHFHIATCEVGGSATVNSVANTYLYTNAVAMFQRIAAGTGGRTFYGEFEHLFFLDGQISEPTAGNPDTTLIEAIADGSQGIDTLAAQLTGGALRFHYPLRTRRDLSDATASEADLVVTPTENASSGMFIYSGGALRPEALRPNRVGHIVPEPLRFANKYTTDGAQWALVVEGGEYNSAAITPASIQGRVMRDDDTPLTGWFTVDASPSTGTWSGTTIDGLPHAPRYQNLEFRAVDANGDQITEIFSSNGLRGGFFCTHAKTNQSQFQIPLVTADGINPFPAGAHGYRVYSNSANGLIEPLQLTQFTPTSYFGTGLGYTVQEAHSRFPDVPVVLCAIGESGQSAEEWESGGTYFARWAAMRDYLGLSPANPIWMHGGHSNTQTNPYLSTLGAQLAAFEEEFGTAWRVEILPTTRNRGIGSSSGYTTLDRYRDAMQQFAENEAGRSFHAGTLSVVVADADGVTQPHPAPAPAGVGVTGAYVAMTMMGGQGAIDGPAKLDDKTVESATQVSVGPAPFNADFTKPTATALTAEAPPDIFGSITPGSTITIINGVYSGFPAANITGTLTLDGVDVTANMIGQEYTLPADSEGKALQWSETASNSSGADVSQSVSATIGLPIAAGGTESDITDGGINYRLHEFAAADVLVVTEGGEFEVLLVGPGGPGGSTGGYTATGGGSGGDVVPSTLNLEPGTYAIQVAQSISAVLGDPDLAGTTSAFGLTARPGGEGGGWQDNGVTLYDPVEGGGGHGSVNDFTAAPSNYTGASHSTPPYSGGDGFEEGSTANANRSGGGGRGAGGGGADATITGGGDGGAGITSNITGASVEYGRGGGGASREQTPGAPNGSTVGGVAQNGVNPGDGGGGVAAADNSTIIGGAGASGRVFVRYRR